MPAALFMILIYLISGGTSKVLAKTEDKVTHISTQHINVALFPFLSIFYIMFSTKLNSLNAVLFK